MEQLARDLGRRLSDSEDEVDAALELVRTHLGMDVVFVTEVRDGREICRALHGDGASFGIALGDRSDGEASLCRLMLEGAVPTVIRDTAAEARTRDLAATRQARVGAYIGVPLYGAEGGLYGMLCGFSHSPVERLDERDAAFMRLLGSVAATRLETRAFRERRRAEIDDVLAHGRPAVALQPILTANGQWSGAEALARFALGPPDAVFSQAREVGRGADLELLALRSALAVRPEVPSNVYLSVNVGPAAVLHSEFTDAIRGDGELRNIVLEITEHTAIDDYESLNAVLTPLREDGLRLAIDDVGAGYASLRHVWRLRPDIIKVDRSLVDGICRDPAQRSIVTSIVLMALDLAATVVAEGVEHDEDVATLATLGIDALQGYLFAAPTTDRTAWASWGDLWIENGPSPARAL